jgi:hypothetical protein
MANWSNPVLTSTYTNFMNELKDRDTDLALQFDGTTSSNLATGTIRWDSTAGRWKKWNGSSWAELAATYALTALSTTGNATIGGTLSVTGSTALAAATATTPATADNSTKIATTAFVKAQNYAPLASPTLTGTPAAPTASIGTNTTQIATTAFVNAEIANDALLKTGGTLTGPITLSGDPTADLHAVPRQWVESRASKESCRAATTSNITLSGTQTIDGVALSIGDRVLVNNQSTARQNGIYVVASGAWTRATDGNTWNDLVGAYTTIEQGLANGDSMWLCEINKGGTLDTTDVSWQLISNAQIAALGALANDGLIARTKADTLAARSIGVSGTGLSVTNGNGVSGNPTVVSNATSANTASTIVARDASGNFAAGTLTLTSFNYSGTPTSSSTGAFELPSGTTAQRPTAAQGQIRYNTSISQFEGYNGSAWDGLAGNGIVDSQLTGTTCKAWVNFNGTFTVAIRASFNVSSITDNGTGDYTVNFTTALADANYALFGITGNLGGNTDSNPVGFNDKVTAPTSSSARINVGTRGWPATDQQRVSLAIFR